MKQKLKRIYDIVKAVAITLILIVIGLYALSYVLLSVPSVQNRIRTEGEKALSDLLHTQVSIQKIDIDPFNELALEHVLIPDQKGDTLFTIDHLGAGVSLYNLLRHRRLVFTYGEIVGLHGRITRPDADSPTNMQFLIDAFKPKPNQPPKPYDITIHNVVVRQSDVSYDVLNAPERGDRLDVNHLHFSGISADVALPRIKNNDFDIRLRRLSLAEKSGLDLRNLSLRATINDTTASLTSLHAELPHSELNLGDMKLSYSSLKNLGKELTTMPLSLVVDQSHVMPADLAFLQPSLKSFDEPCDVTIVANGTIDDLNVSNLHVASKSGGLQVQAAGSLAHLRDAQQRIIDVPHFEVNASANDIARITSNLKGLSPQAHAIINRVGSLKADGALMVQQGLYDFDVNVSTSLGEVTLDGQLVAQGDQHISGKVFSQNFELGKLLARENLIGALAIDADVQAVIGQGKLKQGKVKGEIEHIDFKGYRYHNIVADVETQGQEVGGELAVNDPNGQLHVVGNAVMGGADTRIDASIDAHDVRLGTMGLINKYRDHALSFDADLVLTGNSLATLDGAAQVSGLSFADPTGTGLHISHLSLDADSHSQPQHIELQSDYINGTLTGAYNWQTLVPSVKHLLGKAFPKFFAAYDKPTSHPNDFDFDFTVFPVDEWQNFLKLPVKIVYDTHIKGHVDEAGNSFDLSLDAPYLLQGNKVIEGTSLVASMEPGADNVTLRANTLYPAKKGKILLGLDANGVNNRLDTQFTWKMMRDHDFHGDLSLSTLLDRAEDRSWLATIDVNPSVQVFNDTAWHVQPSVITLDHGAVNVNNFVVSNDRQSIRANGVASRNPDDMLTLELKDVSLDYIFETLNINNVDFGGRATGQFFARELMSGSPQMWTPRLHVDGLCYNKALMGDADIESSWDNALKAVMLKADVAQRNGLHSLIDGGIYIGGDSLHLTFDAQRANVAFMKPFMSAFSSDVQGEASGHAVLYGTFKDINLYGDICADSLRMKVDFTNVYYTCAGDSVHMVPGLITFNNITMRDRDGHTAKMNGWMRHENFHRPVFSFEMTNADNFLCYDTDAAFNPDWYGLIYGNGAAFISGSPGIVEIKVNMETAPGSKFTFVMSDTQVANEYNFITFRDRDTKDLPPAAVVEEDSVPAIVRQFTQAAQVQTASPPSAFNIDLQGDITPDAQLIIVMDPIGGDQIKCTGSGNMRLTYGSNEELAMYGKYTLEKGNYNFTLQDIIIKEFTIRDGSSITFQGDPYAATLDLKAQYSLNANISDLDESFASDPEINRTNVPVHALLNANGAINQPEINFDLEFPTLTTDAYRKIKSIISTEDMMNRQIIYLLALNRFYTPDYMNTSTRNNELSSVASSTISSQLSSILGKMSENWSIAPNFRSDKGDFSDMEVDVALSSQLLNNRLLLNGNFGYRDNTYNTRNSNFIGDFDIEYLLNRRGTFRLKAYNHFNDQTYYVRNALTTQGVGIVWKHDFDRGFGFLRRHKSAAPDTTVVVPADSVVVAP